MTEIFRHLRPLRFDRARGDLVPLAGAGGVSFMLRPVQQQTYDFWVTYVPPGNTLTARTATTALRRAAERGTAPWGQLQLSERPLLEQLADAVINHRDMPSTVATLIINILINNDAEGHRKEQWRQAAAEQGRTYSESD